MVDGEGVPRKESTGTSLSNVLSKSNVSTISFQPRSAAAAAPPAPSAPASASASASSMRAKLAEAPVFVPRSANTSMSAASSQFSPASASASTSQAMPSSAPTSAAYTGYAPYETYAYDAPSAEPRSVRHPLHYHLYAPPFPHVSNFHPTHLAAMTFFMDPALHEDLVRKQEALFASPAPHEPSSMTGIPESLHVYHSLVPLERGTSTTVPSSLINTRFHAQSAKGLTGATGDPSRVFGRCSHAYKASCTLDGKCYVLRRFEHLQLAQPGAIGAAERWRKIRHPNIVAVREAFTTRAFGDDSVVFVYDYHPLATTLYMEHMTVKPLEPDRRTGRLQPVSMHVPERVLWSYACQLTSLLHVIHGAGLAARCIEPSKVLRTGHNRLRLNGCAIFDVLTYQPPSKDDAAERLLAHQQDDLVALGRLLLCTGCNNVAAAMSEDSSASFQRTYSAELHDFVQRLVQRQVTSVSQAMPLLTHHLADEMASSLHHSDLLEAALMRELENGRLVRLLCKINAVSERPEYRREDGHVTETGERYVLKLFRDMVFHTVDEHGHPTLDLSHVLVHLNKLDAGVDEQIMLTSCDELNCIIVSYADIKRYIETALQDLRPPRS